MDDGCQRERALVCLDGQTALFRVLFLARVCHFVERLLQIGIVFQEVIDDRLLRCVTGTCASRTLAVERRLVRHRTIGGIPHALIVRFASPGRRLFTAGGMIGNDKQVTDRMRVLINILQIGLSHIRIAD